MPNTNNLRTLLEQVFDDCRENLRDELSSDEYERLKEDFVFHMTDWLDDLESLQRLFANPLSQPVDQAASTLIGFLYHVIPHLTTAGDLLLDHVPNCFAEPVSGAIEK